MRTTPLAFTEDVEPLTPIEEVVERRRLIRIVLILTVVVLWVAL